MIDFQAIPVVWLLALSLLAGSHAQAAPTLPYTRRTHDYSGWNSSIRGDIRTIGMSGATAGLADTFVAAGDNPAGLAMTLPGSGLSLTSNTVYDGNVQAFDQSMGSTNAGVVVSSYPWGFSAGYWMPQFEGQSYGVPSVGDIRTEVSVREIRFAAARMAFNDRLAVGVGLLFGQGWRELDYANPGIPSNSYSSLAMGLNFGALWQFPRRWLLGIHYTTSMTYSVSAVPVAPVGISDFFQPIRSPSRLGIGAGWIPNRFFRLGASLTFIAPTETAALLSDDDRLVGQALTVQPRLGVSYQAVESKELTVHVSTGTYLESSRISGRSDRVHFTAGLEVNPWIFDLGWGIDVSSRYDNYIVSIGLDLIKLARKLDLAPPGWHPPYGGFLPKMTSLSDVGLPRPLVKDWQPRPPEESAIVTVRELPHRIENKVEEVGNKVLEVFGIGDGAAKRKTSKTRKKVVKKPLKK